MGGGVLVRGVSWVGLGGPAMNICNPKQFGHWLNVILHGPATGLTYELMKFLSGLAPFQV